MRRGQSLVRAKRAKSTVRRVSFVTAISLIGAFLMLVTGSVHAAKTKPPSRNTFSVTGSMNVRRYGHKTILLGNSQVLAVTGDTTGANTAELYDPSSGKWTFTGTPAMFHDGGSATRLANGEVLLAGGYNPGFTSAPAFVAAAELYNPATGQWSTTGSLPSAANIRRPSCFPMPGSRRGRSGFQFEFTRQRGTL